MNELIAGAIGDFLDQKAREVWTGALALLRSVLGLVGTLGRIDPSPGAGPISAALWSSMLQLALIIAVILFFAQLAMAALNPRRHMLHAVTGLGQYGIATAISTGLVVALLGAADGLTTVILQQGADVTNAAAAMDRLGLTDDNNAVKAVVLAILAVVAVLPLAVGYGIMLLFRSASILVLIATLPVVTAGLVNLATRHWFWRATRWLLALIFLQPTFALCFTIGSGVVATAGSTAGPAHPGVAQSATVNGSGLVTLLLGLAIMFVALFAPFALFRLFAFVEPGTMPHQAMLGAFSSAMAGFKQSGSGIAGADVGSVLSSATGGRFGSGDSSNDAAGSGADTKTTAAAALAAASGGAGAAGAGASDGASGSADAATSIPGAATSIPGAASPADEQGPPEEPGHGELDGAGAGTAGPVATGATSSDRGTLDAAGSAVAGIAAGAWGAAQGIAGATPMAPAPHGGTAGRGHDPAPTDFGGASWTGRPAASAYRDPSFDRPHPDRSHRDDRGGGHGSDSGESDRDDDVDDDDTGGSGRLTGVL